MSGNLDADTLRRISPLLDEALELDDAQRETWFAEHTTSSPELIPILREMFARRARDEISQLLDRRPDQAIVDAIPDRHQWDFKAGDRVGPYTLLQEIARGGMGEVWRARRTDADLERVVALKLPILSLRRNILVRRFERECDILRSLSHANIATLCDAGLAHDGQPYLALEYVEGQRITEYAERNALDAAQRIRLLRQVMDAVQHAHAKLVIHRDLKPSNVLVTGDGKAMLLDFGIAKVFEEATGLAHETELTHAGGRALTLSYAAPEQILGNPISVATDVWALGVLLYELLAGSLPFGTGQADIAHEVLAFDPASPSQSQSRVIGALPDPSRRGLDTIVLKALRKNPLERYATASEFADDLDRWLQGKPLRAEPPGALTGSTSQWHRRPASRMFAGLAAVGILVAATVYVMTSKTTPDSGLPGTPDAKTVPRADRALAIAVLPFSNLTGDPAQAYVAEALTADITSDLARIEDALVAPVTSALAYKDKALPLADVAKALGVRFVLQGNVQRSDTRLRINAQLHDTANGTQLWSEAFDGDLVDLLALQDRVTARIGNSVGRQVVAVAARESEARKGSPRVADLLLRARAAEAGRQTASTLEEIESLNRQALALEPQNVQAMLGLASALAMHAINFTTPGTEADADRRIAEAHELTVKVRALDPSNTEVYRAIGYVAARRGDSQGNRLAKETYLATHPRSASAHNGLGVWYFYAAEPAKAIPLLQRSLELTPNQLSDTGAFNLGRSYFMLGDDARAIQWLRKSYDMSPNRAAATADWLAMAYARSGQMERARETAQAFMKARPNVRLSNADGIQKSTLPAFRQWHETQRAPAWRKAGLPE